MNVKVAKMSLRATKVVLTSLTAMHLKQKLLKVTNPTAGILRSVCLPLCNSSINEILGYSESSKQKNVKYVGMESSVSNGHELSTLATMKVANSSKCVHTMGHKRFYLPGNLATVYDFGLPTCRHNQILDPLKRIEIMDPGQKLEIVEPEDKIDKSMSLTKSVLKRRRSKMNKHKLRKRRRRDAAKIRVVRMIRAKKKAKKRAFLKKKLIDKLEKIREDHPNSDYFTRPYVIHRLTHW